MVSYMGGIVWMSILELRDQSVERIEQVKIRAGIQIGDRQCSRRMPNE
jgi:hypothetical protein